MIQNKNIGVLTVKDLLLEFKELLSNPTLDNTDSTVITLARIRKYLEDME